MGPVSCDVTLSRGLLLTLKAVFIRLGKVVYDLRYLLYGKVYVYIKRSKRFRVFTVITERSLSCAAERRVSRSPGSGPFRDSEIPPDTTDALMLNLCTVGCGCASMLRGLNRPPFAKNFTTPYYVISQHTHCAIE